MLNARPGICSIGIGVFGLLIAPCAWALEPQVVTFSSADGMRITADYYAPPLAVRQAAPMVILLHMYKSDRSAWKPLASPLHEAGFAVLAVDLRGHGDSATTETRERVHQRETAVFHQMQDDLRGAYDWLAQRPEVDRARFALVGASVGCSVALQYAAKDRSVDALVCLSPGLNYLGLDSAGDIHQITGRQMLMLASEQERDAPYTLKERGSGVTVEIYNHKAHGTEMLGVIRDIEKRVVDFCAAGVGPSSSAVVYGSINSHVYHPPDSGWLERISPTNLRYYSSPKEAEARGLRASKSKGPSDRRRGSNQRRS